MGAPYHNLEQIKQVKKGKYEEYMDDLGRNILRYEGYEYISDHYPYLDIVIITDQKYKISLFRVGIGSSKKNVQRVYRYCQKILDLPSNKIGFIDNGVWVEFSLDENECVTKIEFYRGP